MKTRTLASMLVFASLAAGKAHAQHATPVVQIAHITILVADYDEAIKYYTEILGFQKKADIKFGKDGKERWVTVAPAGQHEVEFVFVEATSKEDAAYVGKQAGTRTLFVINTTNCKQVFEDFKQKGVRVNQEISETPWGKQAQFYDLYGNRFVLLEPKIKKKEYRF